MRTSQLSNLMLNPWVVLAGIVTGGLTGWSHPIAASYIAPLGNLYSSLLQMCVIPILLTAVISSLCRLFITGRATNYIARLFITIALGLAIASVLGILAGIIGQPGSSLQQDAQATLGTMIFNQETTALEQSGTGIEQPGLLMFFEAMIPNNIFASLSQGDQLAVLFFSIIVGIALGSTGVNTAQPVLVILEALYETFIKIIGWLMYALPLGLFCLAAGQMSQLGVEILGAVLKLVGLIYLCVLILIGLYTLMIWLKVGGGITRSFTALRETVVVAFGTSSSFAAIPSAMRGLKEELRISKAATNLVLPLGITLNPPGSVFHFALSTLFIAQLYGVELGISQYFIVFIGAIFAGIGASGAPGIAALSMITIILQPLKLPVDVALILLAAIDPIVDPLLTVVNVHANCATTVLVAQRENLSTPVLEAL
ncbi:MAG TPA: dicarboxylate/amino acid:cation symporter [Leptolyngbyaceae cyanobacterium]